MPPSVFIPLTPKAFDTLLDLVEHHGVVLDKDEAIWPHTVVEENNLNQSISALRRVLGESRVRTALSRRCQDAATLKLSK